MALNIVPGTKFRLHLSALLSRLRVFFENHTRFLTKIDKNYTRVQTKTAKNPTLLGGTYLYSLYSGTSIYRSRCGLAKFPRYIEVLFHV